jgi:hypothetical protein
VPADLLGLATAAAVRVEVCWDVDAWKAKKQKKGGADADEAARLMKGLRDIFNDTNQLQTKMNKLIHNGKEPTYFNTAVACVTRPAQAFRCGGLVIGPGTGTSDEIEALLSHGESVNTEEETNRIIALGGGDFDQGRAKMNELIQTELKKHHKLKPLFREMMNDAVVLARSATGSTQTDIAVFMRNRYGFEPSEEDLTSFRLELAAAHTKIPLLTQI